MGSSGLESIVEAGRFEAIVDVHNDRNSPVQVGQVMVDGHEAKQLVAVFFEMISQNGMELRGSGIVSALARDERGWPLCDPMSGDNLVTSSPADDVVISFETPERAGLALARWRRVAEAVSGSRQSEARRRALWGR